MKALIFDVDGTLAETEELHRAAFNDQFAQAGLNWNWSQEDYAWLLKTTGGKERMRAYADHIRHSISDDEIASLHKAKTTRYRQLVESGALDLRVGIRELIDVARARGLRIGIATTTNLPNVEALSQAAFGRSAHLVFDTIAAGDMVKHKKPAPDVYHLALAQLGVRPEHAIAFEDTLNGVKSAQSAGLRVILSQSTYAKGEDAGGADFVVESFADALALPPFNEGRKPHGRDNTTH